MPPADSEIGQAVRDSSVQNDNAVQGRTASDPSYRAEFLEEKRSAGTLPKAPQDPKNAEAIVAANSELKAIFQRKDFTDPDAQVETIRKLLSIGLSEDQIVRILDVSESRPDKAAGHVCELSGKLENGKFDIDEKYQIIFEEEKAGRFWDIPNIADMANLLKRQGNFKEFSKVLALGQDNRYPWNLRGVVRLLELGLTVNQIEKLPAQLPPSSDTRPMVAAIDLLEAGRSLEDIISLLHEVHAVAKEKSGRVINWVPDLAKKYKDEEIVDLTRFCADRMGNGLNMQIVNDLLETGASLDETKKFVDEVGELPCEEAYDLAMELKTCGVSAASIREYIGNFNADELYVHCRNFEGEGIEDVKWRGKVEFHDGMGFVEFKDGLSPEDIVELQKNIKNGDFFSNADKFISNRSYLFLNTIKILAAPSDLPLEERMELCRKLGEQMKTTEVRWLLSSDDAASNDEFISYLSPCVDRWLGSSSCKVAFECAARRMPSGEYEKVLDFMESHSLGKSNNFLAGYIRSGIDTDQVFSLAEKSASCSLADERFNFITNMIKDLKTSGMNSTQLVQVADASISAPSLPYEISLTEKDWVENLIAIGFGSSAVFELCLSASAHQDSANQAIESLLKDKSLTNDQIRNMVEMVEKEGGKEWPQIFSLVPGFVKENGFKQEEMRDFVKSVAAIIESNNLTYDLKRYPYELIRELVRDREDPEYKKDAPTALIVFNQADWNGAFRGSGGRYWKSIIDAGFRIELFEATTDVELGERISQIGQGKGRINYLMIAGHGTQTSLGLGAVGEAGDLDVSDGEQVAAWKRHLAEGVQIQLHACSNASTLGGAENNARFLVKALGVKDAQVFAAPIPTSLEDIVFDESGRIKKIILFDGDAVNYSAENN